MPARLTSRFGAASTAREVIEGIDLHSRRAIVTGGASGIGVETARALALAGAEVVLAVRNVAAGSRVAADLQAEIPGAKVEVERLDLASLASVREFAARQAGRRLHLLINNAGVMATPQGWTADGLETQIGTNHFGHFLLSALLLPALEAGAEDIGARARVVSLSSIAHRRSGIRFEDIHYRTRPYDKWEAYGQSKTANSLFAVELYRRFRDRGVTANAVMPGGIMTGLQKFLPEEEMRALGWIDDQGRLREGFKTTEQGAATSVWAATAPELETVGGLYLEDCAQAKPASKDVRWFGVEPWALDPAAATRLWEVSEETVGVRT
jgi:NAD(P)-dependent dehydrogenase (short-subunit alcohol dehydrogenase family)